MKVALVCANIGIDSIHIPPQQTAEYELFYYTENTLPFPLPSFNNRLKGKYIKTQTHRFLEHDIFIWVDGNIEIITPEFIATCLNELSDNDILIEQHKTRANAYEEIDYIHEHLRKGSPYLLKRYAKAPLHDEYRYYREQGLPFEFPLYQCSFFARNNDAFTNNVFNDWWDHILRFSNFDQTQFSYVAWKHSIDIKAIEIDHLLIRHRHE